MTVAMPESEEMSRDEQARLAIQQAAMEAYTNQQTQIKYDEESKMIYMIGPASDIEKIEEVLERIVEQFEEIEEPTDGNVKVFQLKHLDVSVAATILEQMFNDQPQPAAAKAKHAAQAQAKTTADAKTAKDNEKGEDGEGAAGARRREEEEKARAEQEAQQMPGGQRIRVFPNPRDQTLVVRAAKEDFPLIAELLLKIDRPTEQPPVDIQIFQLKHLNALEVEDAIKAILKIDQGTRGRAMMRRPMMGRAMGAAGMMGMDAMIEQLEQEMLELEASGLLGGLDVGQPGQPGQPGEKGTMKINPAKDINITSDATTNSIIVAAPREGMKLVKKLIEKLEEQDIPTRIESFPLQYADATKAAAEVEKLFQSRGGESRGGLAGRLTGIKPSALGTISVASDARTNTIVVRALEPDMEKVRKIITELDKEPFGQQVQLYAVNHGNAKSMAATLQAIFVQDPGAVGARAVKITADDETNSIMVWAPEAQQKMIAERIAQLDASVGERITPKQIQLKVANPSNVATKLLDIFVGKGGRGRSGKNEIQIAGDDASKILFITAPPDLYTRIEELARMMDKSATQDIQVFPLKNANAVEVLARFREMMGQIYQQVKGGVNEVFAATADDRINALIVAGTPAVFEAVTKVLQELDVGPSEANTITTVMFPLVRGNAASVAASVNALYIGRPNIGGVPAPKATAEPTANVVYITGTRAQIDQIKATVIDPLEQYAPAVALKSFQIPIQHADVTTLAQTLNNYFSQRFAAMLAAGGSARAPAEMVVKIVADSATRLLLVECTESNKAAIDDLLKMLDSPAVSDLGQQVKVIPVKFADLGYTSQALSVAFTKTGKIPENEKISIIPEYGTQSLIVKARAEDIADIEKLLAQIDRSDAGNMTPPETIRLQNGRASTVSTTITQMIATTKRRDRTTGQYPVSVSPDDTSNTLLVTAINKKEMDEVKVLIGQLDTQPATDTERTVQSYPLQYADLGSVMQAINTRFADYARMPIQQQVNITPDYINNSLLVTASDANHKKVEVIVKELDQSNMASVAMPRTIKVQNAKASILAAALTETIRTSKKVDRRTNRYPISVTSDDASNTLIVTANEKDMAEAMQLIEQLDVAPPKEQDRLLKSYALKFADLGSVMQAINTRFADNVRLPVKDQVGLTPDHATNALMVTASLENQEEVKKIIEELDKSDVATMRIPETIKVENIKASDLANTLTQMIRTSKKVDKRTGQYPVTVSANDASNTLLLTATATDMAEMKALIAKLDVAVAEEDQRITRPYPVRYVDMSAVVSVINSRFDSNNKTRSLKDQVQAFPEAATNSIVVTAAAENHDKVKALIDQLDQESEGTIQQEIIRLTNARADDLAQVVTTTYRARKLRPGEQAPSITADANSNSLVVSASMHQTRAIKELIAELDKPVDPSRVEELRVIPLQYVEATEIKDILTEYLRKPGLAPGRGAAELVNDTRLQASPTMNALVVSGSTSEIERVQKLVQTMDREDVAGSSSVPQIIKVRNTSASQLAATLTRMFTEPATARGRGRAGAADLVPLILADDTTNTLVVRARTVDFNQIEMTVAKLDVPGEGTSGMEVIQVNKGTDVAALAREIERTINMGERLKAQQQPGYRAAQLAIGVDERSPALIVAGSPELFPMVKGLVARLQEMKPSGGTTARVIPVRNISPQDMKRVIQQLIDQQQGKTTSGRR
ncbi:MAG TPA: secretin N-terminal domain-containing protein [Phycisphaerae bacterium]|nr:secretin N-terminal domain-containing protein [Phycisphaerae bacterium]